MTPNLKRLCLTRFVPVSGRLWIAITSICLLTLIALWQLNPPAWCIWLWWSALALLWFIGCRIVLRRGSDSITTARTVPSWVLLHQGSSDAFSWLQAHGFTTSASSVISATSVWQHEKYRNVCIKVCLLEGLFSNTAGTEESAALTAAIESGQIGLILMVHWPESISSLPHEQDFIGVPLARLMPYIKNETPLYLIWHGGTTIPGMDSWNRRLSTAPEQQPLGIHFGLRRSPEEQLADFWAEWRTAEAEVLSQQLSQHNCLSTRQQLDWHITLEQLSRHTQQCVSILRTRVSGARLTGCYFSTLVDPPISGIPLSPCWLASMLQQTQQGFMLNPRQNAPRRLVGLTTATLVVALCWHHWHQVWTEDEELLKHWMIKQHEKEDGTSQALDQMLSRLEMLMPALGDTDHVWQWGLYRGHLVNRQTLYFQSLIREMQPWLMQFLTAQLEQQAMGSLEHYDTLRAIRALDSPQPSQHSFLFHFLDQKLGSTAARLRPHLITLLHNYNWQNARQEGETNAVERYAVFASEIRNAQRYWQTCTTAECYYTLLRQQLNWQLNQLIPLWKLLGPHAQQLFIPPQTSPVIPRLFMPDGAKQFMTATSQWTEWQSQHAWLISPLPAIAASDIASTQGLQQIRNLYQREYIDTWLMALGELHIAAENMPQLVNRYQHAADGIREIQSLIDTHVNVIPPLLMPIKIDPEGSNTMVHPSRLITIQPENQWQDLERLFHRIELNLALLWQRKFSIENEHQLSAELEQLEQTQLGLTSWQQELVNTTYREVNRLAVDELERDWQEEIKEPFTQLIEQKYPFNPRARDEAGLGDVEAFLAPGGKIDRFFNDKIEQSPLMKQALSSPHNQADGLVEFKERLLQLQNALFDDEGHLDLRASIEPLRISPSTRRVIINLAGQIIDVRHGLFPRMDVHWPNDVNPDGTSQITWIGLDGTERRQTVTGVWSFWRLLSSAKGHQRLEDEQLDFSHGPNIMSIKAKFGRNTSLNSLLQSLDSFQLPAQLVIRDNE